MKFTLLATLVGLASGVDNQNLYYNRPACSIYNNMISQVTNNKCNSHNQNKDACLNAFERVIRDLESSQGSYQYTLHDFLRAQQTCRYEIVEAYPEALLATLEKSQKKEKTKCKRKNLNAEDKYACTQRPKDIKMLEEKIQRKRKQCKIT